MEELKNKVKNKKPEKMKILKYFYVHLLTIQFKNQYSQYPDKPLR